MRNKFSRFCRRLRGGADPNDDISDDDTYDDKPIVVPKHKRGREMKSSILSRKAVEAVRQMSLSTKHYDPLNTHADHASVVEEYHKGYSNDQIYLVPDSTLRTMKNIVNYQLKKPPTTYYVGGKNVDSLPQPTIFDNIKMSLDSVMQKIDGLDDDDDDLSDLTTTSDSSTSDSSAIDVAENGSKEVKEESQPVQKTEEENKNVNPENIKSETETAEKVAVSNITESLSSESSDSVKAKKQLDNEQELKDELVPSNLTPIVPGIRTDTDHLKTGASHPEAYSNVFQADTDHMITDMDEAKADTGHVKPEIHHTKPVQNRLKRPHEKQYFLLEGKFEENLKPVFVIKKCKLTNDVISDRLTHGVNHKKLIFTQKHSKKLYVDIEGQFVHKEMTDKYDEYMHENKADDIQIDNDCEFSIRANRLCHDNSKIKINITGHLVRQDNSVRYVPVLVLKLRNKSSKVNIEPQLQSRQDTMDMTMSNQTRSQLYENINKQMGARDEVQRPSINYQKKSGLTNEDGNSTNQRPELFQYGPLINYQAMPVLISGPSTSISKQEINLRKEIGQGIVNKQIVPVLTGDHDTTQRERITYRAVNSQVMPVFQMPVFQIPVEYMHIPQNQYCSVIPLRQPIENANYLNPQVMQHNEMSPNQNLYSSRIQNNSSIEANTLLFPNIDSSKEKNVEQIKADRENALNNNDESADKNTTATKKLKKSKHVKKTPSSDKTRPMDTGGAGNKINIVNNPIVGQLEEFFIGYVHIPQTQLPRNRFEPSHLRQKKFSLDDIVKIKNTAGYLLRINLKQSCESYSCEIISFEKAILKSQLDIEHFFLNTDNIESLLVLPQIIEECKIHYTEMHLKTCFEESCVKITLHHTFVVVFCNGSLWFIALENTNSDCLQKKKITLPHYFGDGGFDKSASRLKCVTKKDTSKRKFSNNHLRKLIEKLVTCSQCGPNTAEMHGKTNFLSITTSSSHLLNTGFTQNETFNIYWDVIYFLT